MNYHTELSSIKFCCTHKTYINIHFCLYIKYSGCQRSHGALDKYQEIMENGAWYGAIWKKYNEKHTKWNDDDDDKCLPHSSTQRTQHNFIGSTKKICVFFYIYIFTHTHIYIFFSSGLPLIACHPVHFLCRAKLQ